ncbi:MAG: phytanoyl-CoA dioxygenase family protein [Actinobacteria bacterium]|nr:phytanoyl-CoA dioxygenase family protein [Actinomycetota bacterium]
MRAISDDELERWHAHGYVVIEHLLDSLELAAVRENIAMYLPSWDQYSADPNRYSALMAATNNWPVQSFPFAGSALNGICTHRVLIALARQLLATDDVALSHSRLRGKYAGTGDHEQELHVDYWNNTLAYPTRDEQIVDLPCIIYYTDVTIDLGPTYVVSQQHTKADPLVPFFRPRTEFQDLYSNEIPVTVPAGSALLYSMRTFHRGSAMHASEGVRFSHHMSWRNARMRWAGQCTFQHDGGRPEMDRFLEQATPEQRELVGFPPVGDPYWNQETIAGIQARYPTMDTAPYERRRST